MLVASRQSPLSWMALTASTSLGGQRGNGAPRVGLGAIVALVLEGWQGVRGGPASGSGVVSCLAVNCWCFLASLVAALVVVYLMGYRWVL